MSEPMAPASAKRPGRHPRVRNRPIAEILKRWSRPEVEARFRSRVNLNGPVPAHCPELGNCHVWTGDHTSHGYGLFQRIGAHRVAMWLATGEEPGERHVLHHCDNPPCVRRSHLRYGTPAENAADKSARGRASKPGLKLSDAEVESLRTRYAAGEKTADLIAEFGISQQQASRIVSGGTRRLAPVQTPWRSRGLKDPRHKLTDVQRDAIRSRRRDGESAASLAAEFGVTPPYVSEIVNGRCRDRHGTAVQGRKNRPPLTPDVVREIRAMCAQGISKAEVARAFGVDPGGVSRIAARLAYREVV